MTRLTIITPTAGRLSLRRTLESYVHQMAPEDEYIVVGDVTDGRLETTEAIVADFDRRFRYVPGFNERHSWGHHEIQQGIALAKQGNYLIFQDDDDVATPTALADIRVAIAELDEPRPLLFRFRSWMGIVFWDEQGVIARNRVGGHCLVTPNLPGRVGRWAEHYTGDYEFIRSTIDLWPNKDADVVWKDSLIAWARPTEQQWQTMLRPKTEALA